MAERQSWLADLSRQFKRHRQGRPGWFLRVKRDHLQLLSSELPPRPGEGDGAPAQRALLLSTPLGPSTAAAALAEACMIFDAVMAGTWQWPDPLMPSAGDPGHLRPSVLARMRERLRVAVVGEQVSERTWDNTYVPYLRALERMAGEEWPDDVTFLTTALRRWPSNSRGRQMAYDRFRRLWKEAGWPWPDELAAMRGTGKAVAHPDGVTAFTDQEIERLREQIKTSQLTAADLVAWDCLIVFGLRPAELQGLQVAQQGRLLVATVQREKRSSRGSVGRRQVPAVPPKGWPSDCHGLLLRWQEYGLPAAVVNAESPGEVMARQLRRFRNKGAFRKELKPYSLRHLFAIRLNTDLGLQVREAAELMGHSPAVHLSTYGRRLDQPKLLEKVAGLQGLQ